MENLEDSFLNNIDSKIYKMLWSGLKPSKIIKTLTSYRIIEYGYDEIVLICRSGFNHKNCKGKMIYFKSLGEAKMYYAHDSFCNFSEGENKIGILKSQYNISTVFKSIFRSYERYLHRKDQLKCISKSNDDIDENEPKLTEEQEQERHSILLKKLENISSINISSPNDTVLKEVLKPTNQNVSKNSYTMNAGKISVENECEEELPLLFED